MQNISVAVNKYHDLLLRVERSEQWMDDGSIPAEAMPKWRVKYTQRVSELEVLAGTIPRQPRKGINSKQLLHGPIDTGTSIFYCG
jgi:hypothetical protein